MFSLYGRQLSVSEAAYKNRHIKDVHFQLRFVECFVHVNVQGLMPYFTV